jgi:hypothetical protein
MRSLSLHCLILADSCFDENDLVAGHVPATLRDLSARRGCLILVANVSRSRSLAPTLRRLGIDMVHVVDSPPAGILEAVKTELAGHGISRDSVIAIGALEGDLELHEAAALYLHVGYADVLRRKVRNVVPLTGQFAAGVANALEYLTRHDRELDLLEHADLVAFVERTRQRYAEPGCGGSLLEKGVSAARFVQQCFPEEVAGVFGSGYPFYLLDGVSDARAMDPPPSIHAYFEEQAAYFRARCIPATDFERSSTLRLSQEELARVFGIPVARNRFDADLFEDYGREVPQVPPGRFALCEFLEHNCFDIASDVWPCQMCTALQSVENYPRQRQLKDTNTDCLDCGQTSLIVRNVMGAASDVDLIVVVRGRADDVAERLKRLVIEEATYHLYDLDLPRAIIDGDGPLDVFIFELDGMMQALHRLTTSNWRNTRLATIALWCPTAHFEARLDLVFPLAFASITIRDSELARCYEAARTGFAAQSTTADIVDVLREGSIWTTQLMANPGLVDALCARLDRWRA